MRPRDFDRAVSAACDVLIVGGTCHGLALAREAALAGLRATLIEPLDFGADAYSYHWQLVPGGLHLLRRGRIGRARRAVRARRRLARTAPWLIRPLPFLAPTERGVVGNRLAWRVAFKIDDWVGRQRNLDVEPELHLPPARLVSKTATLRLYPGVRREGLTGSVQWYDYQILDPHRFAVALAAGAEAAGAEVLNRVDVVDVVRDGGRISGLALRDSVTGAEAMLRAGLVIDAAPHHATRKPGLGASLPPATVRHLTALTSKPASDIALIAGRSQSRRLVLMPSHSRALIGLTEPLTAAAGESVTDNDFARMVSQASEAFPALGLTRADITSLHASVAAETLSHVATDERGAMTVYANNAAAGLDAALRAVRVAARLVGKPLRVRARDTTLPGAGIADHEALLIESARKFGIDVPPSVMRHLLARYADKAATIVRLVADNEALKEPVGEQHPQLAAEVVHAIRHEKAVRLSDVLRRLGLETSSAEPKLSGTAAAVAAQELGWDQARLAAEIQEVERHGVSSR